jgi:histidine ammonia-lyase
VPPRPCPTSAAKNRELHRDIEAVSQMIDSGELLAAVRAATA